MSISATQGGHKKSFVIHLTVSKLSASFATKLTYGNKLSDICKADANAVNTSNYFQLHC